MPGVGGNVGYYIDDSSGNTLNAYAQSATFDTEWLDVGACEYFGLWCETTTQTGNVDIDVECSIDGGTTVCEEFPADVNSETAADTQQITSADAILKYWRNPFPTGAASGLSFRVRFEVTLASGPVTFTMVLLQKNPNIWT